MADSKPSITDVISIADAAHQRGVSVQAMSRLVKKGRFTVYDIGGRKFLLRKEVYEYRPDKGGRPRKG